MEVKRIVVVGCGSIGKRHARLLAARNDVEVELFDVSHENIAAMQDEIGSVRIHESYESALASKPTAVLIATPIPAHAQQSMAALEADVHVLCEKPMCDTLANARQVLARSRESDRVFGVAFVMHFHPAMRRIRELIRSGKLGQILHVHWHVGSYLTLMSSVSRHQATLPGALLLDYAHQPDVVHWWLEKLPAGVYAAGHMGGSMPLQSNPNVLALVFDYHDPVSATINLNYVQHPMRGGCEISGDEGWAAFDAISGQLQIGNRDQESTEMEDYSLERDELFVDQIQAFVDAIDGKREPESPAQDAIGSMQMIEAAMKSWPLGERVMLELN